MNFSEFYASCYNEIHQQKAYSNDAIRLISFLQTMYPEHQFARLLDFGCGTGRHLSALGADNFELWGYDPSINMIAVAKEAFPEIHFNSSLQAIPNEMDLVYSFFDVVSYQSVGEQLDVFFESIAEKIKNSGVIIVDGWYQEGVQLSPPRINIRSFDFKGRKICRRVEPSSSDEFKTTNLKISLTDERSGEVLALENHTITAHSQDDLRTSLEVNGFKHIVFRDGNDWGQTLNRSSWKFMVSAEI